MALWGQRPHGVPWARGLGPSLTRAQCAGGLARRPIVPPGGPALRQRAPRRREAPSMSRAGELREGEAGRRATRAESASSLRLVDLSEHPDELDRERP